MALIFSGGRTYYIQSFRRAGKVTSKCLGSGRVALAYARLDVEIRDKREADPAECRRERKRVEDVDRLLAGLCREAIELGGAALEAAAYHQHKRQWRKRRMMTKTAVPVRNALVGAQ
jgi:hypothetical protein